MALSDESGESVTGGWFLYDGTIPTRVQIVARDHDANYRWRHLAKILEPGEAPVALGPERRLYYVNDNLTPFATVEDAKTWAGRQPWAPIVWDVR